MYIINIVNILIHLHNLKPIKMLFDFLINKKARNKYKFMWGVFI